MLLFCLKHEESLQALPHTANQENLDKFIKLTQPCYANKILLVVQRRNIGNNSVKPISCQKKKVSVNEDEHIQELAIIDYQIRPLFAVRRTFFSSCCSVP